MARSSAPSIACGRAIRLLAIVLALAAAVISPAGAGHAEASVVAGPLTFGSPQLIDTGAPFGEPAWLGSLSCTTPNFCVGAVSGELSSEIISSSDPTSGSASDWTVVQAQQLPGASSGASINGASCVTVSGGPVCVAVGASAGGAGMILTSHSPDSGASAWTQASGPPSEPLTNGPACAADGANALCVAAYDNPGSNDTALYASSDPGGSWSSVLTTTNDYIGPITCPSIHLCLAGSLSGDIYTSSQSGAAKPTAAWTATPAVTGISGELFGLSCSSTSFCLASGVDASGNPQIATTTDPADGSSATWTTSSPPSYVSEDISCFSDSGLAPPHVFCLGEDSTPGVVDVSRDGGGQWAQEASEETGASGFSGVFDCPESASGVVCIGGGEGDIDYSDTADQTSGTSWSAPVLVTPGLDPVELFPQSCPSSSLCVAADYAGRILTSTDPGGGSAAWSSTLAAPGNSDIDALACPSNSLCVAMDSTGGVLRSTDPPGGAATWSTSGDIDDSSALPVIGVSCATDTETCIAYDFEGVTFRSLDGGVSWSGPSATISGDDPIAGLACPTATLCVSVSADGLAERSTDGGATWTSSPYDDQLAWPTFHVTQTMACAPRTEVCVALDSSADVLTSTDAGASWSVPSASIDASPIETLACSSGTLCVAIDDDGDVLTSTDPAAGGASWSAPSANLMPSPNLDDKGLACAATANACLASDAEGNVLATAGWTASGPPLAPGPAPASSPSASPLPARFAAASPPVPPEPSLGVWRAHGKSGSMPVSCVGSGSTSCAVVLSASVTETLRNGEVVAVSASGRHHPQTVKRTVVVATGRATIRAGLSQAVKLVLNSAGQWLLRAHHPLLARLSDTGPGVVESSRTIAFTAPLAKDGQSRPLVRRRLAAHAAHAHLTGPQQPVARARRRRAADA